MNLSQVRSCINAARNAVQYLKQAVNHTGQENVYLNDESAEIENGYKGASSPNLDEKSSSYSKEVNYQSNELSNEIRSIQSIISDLEALERQLIEEERREQEAREREARERAARERAASAGGR